MSSIVTVSYPRHITIEAGVTVQVIGTFIDEGRILSHHIMIAERGIYYDAEPEEYGEIKPYHGPISYRLPLIGQVVSCRQNEKYTNLSVFPTGQTLHEYGQLSGAWSRAAVPAFWKMAEEKTEWERTAIPLHWTVFDEESIRPQLLDPRAAIISSSRYRKVRGRFDTNGVARALWQSARKLQQAERHLERLKLIKRLRFHLYTAMKSAGRNFLLKESREESGLTVEAAAASVFSSLDILAHALNEIYELGHSQSTVGFILAVSGKNVEEVEGEPVRGKCMERLHPNDDLTLFLKNERTDWIRDLEGWRHYIIHHGCLDTGDVVGGDAYILAPRQGEVLPLAPLPDIEAVVLVEIWTTRLKALIERSLMLIQEKAERDTEGVNEIDDLRNIELPPPNLNTPLPAVYGFLELWKADEADLPQKFQFMYSRLSDAWRGEWSFQEFRAFMSAHPLHGYRFEGGVFSGTHEEFRQLHSLSAFLDFDDKTVLWRFTLVPDRSDKLRMHRLPISTIPSFHTRITRSEPNTRQSGRDTGHRDLIFTGAITNVGGKVLEDASVHVFWQDLSEAKCELGRLEPGETKRYETSWPDAYVPLNREHPSLIGAGGTFRIRVVYCLPTGEGRYWSEEPSVE